MKQCKFVVSHFLTAETKAEEKKNAEREKVTFRNETDATQLQSLVTDPSCVLKLSFLCLMFLTKRILDTVPLYYLLPSSLTPPFHFFFLYCPLAPLLLMYPEWSMGLSTLSAGLWCGNRLAVCVLHIACSQRPRRSEQNNNHKSGLSAECQDCLVVGSLQHTRATLLSFAGKKCLRSKIPQTGHMLAGMKRLNYSSSLHM